MNTKEPTLESIDDYDHLSGNKKSVVYKVVLMLLFFGMVYSLVYNKFNTIDDTLEVNDVILKVPAGK